MKLRWAACVLVMVGSFAVTVPAEAQGLNDVLIRLLSGGCAELRGNTSPFGPQLDQLCQGGGGGAASTAGGTVGGETRGGGEAQHQVSRRLRQRQAAASADTGGALSLFASVDYQSFDKDTTRFEGGFGRDTVGGTIGADYLFRNGLVLGTAVSYGHEFGSYDRAGASTTTPTGSWSTGASCRSPACSSTRWPATR